MGWGMWAGEGRGLEERRRENSMNFAGRNSTKLTLGETERGWVSHAIVVEVKFDRFITAVLAGRALLRVTLRLMKRWKFIG